MSLNIVNILKVRDLILAHPDNFDMNYFGFNPDTGTVDISNIEHECGTVACIAGWACYAAGDPRAVSRGEVMETAADFFGLDLDVARPLFLPGDDGNISEAGGARAYSATPQQAATVLNRLAKTGEVNWRDI